MHKDHLRHAYTKELYIVCTTEQSDLLLFKLENTPLQQLGSGEWTHGCVPVAVSGWPGHYAQVSACISAQKLCCGNAAQTAVLTA